MPYSIENLADQFDALLTEPPPPSTIDAALAVATGRRILRRRRRLTLVAVTATTALACALVATVPLGHGGTTATGTSTSTSTATATSTPALATGRDPLVVPGKFGWLPANAQNVEYTFAPGQQVSTVAKGDGDVRSTPAMLWLTAFDPGQTPTLNTFADGAKQLRVDAPPVNGHTAYWVTANAADPTNGADTYLDWQTPSGQWAELHGYYLGDDPIEATMLHVAAGVTLGAAQVPLPISIGGLPVSAVADEIDAQQPSAHNTAWEANLIFTLGGSYVDITVHAAGATLTSTTATAGAVCDANRNGLAVCVSLIGATENRLLPGGLPGLLKSIVSFGPDPKNWTTNVLPAK